MTEEGTLTDFLGIHMEQHANGNIELKQPHLIQQILDIMRITPKTTKVRQTPAASSIILTRHDEDVPHDESFNYRTVLGKFCYLDRGSLPDIFYISHQCARFASDPKKKHASALRWLARYLL